MKLLLFVIAMAIWMTGCASDFAPSLVEDVAVPAVVAPKDVVVPTTIPDAKDLFKDIAKSINLQNVQISDILAAQKELNAQRQDLAAKEASQQAAINNAAAQLKANMDADAAREQSRLNKAKADADTSNAIAAARAADEIKQGAADAAMARNMAYFLFAIGTAAFVGGAVVVFFIKQPVVGTAIAVIGTAIVLLAANLVAMGPVVRLCLAAGLIIALVGAAAHVAATLYWNWQTSKQAAAKMLAATENIAAGNTDAAALQIAAAQALTHVAAPGYKATETSVSAKAMALLQSPVATTTTPAPAGATP